VLKSHVKKFRVKKIRVEKIHGKKYSPKIVSFPVRYTVRDPKVSLFFSKINFGKV